MKQDYELVNTSEMHKNADALYGLIFNKKPINNNLVKVNDFKLKELCSYLANTYINFGEIVYTYVEEMFSLQSIDEIRINKIFIYYALISENLEKDKYRKLFNVYLQYGGLYLDRIYKKDVIDNELFFYMKSEEDLFLLYMYHAEKNKNNGASYLKYLKQALLACPDLKKGIQLLYKDIEEKNVKTQQKMEDYKIKVQATIADLINNNELICARTIISEYEAIEEADADIISMKAVIEIMDNNLQLAENILINGIGKYQDNFDLVYNSAYLYELMDDKKKAVYFYKKAIVLTKDKLFINDITNKLKSLEN